MTNSSPPSSLARSFFAVGPHAGAHRVAARAGLSVFVPLLLLVVTGHAAWTTYAAFGAFTSLYGRMSPHRDRASLQISVAGILVGVVTLGCAVSALPQPQWWVVGIGAVVAATVSVLADALRWHPPGPLFVVFAFTVCASLPPGRADVVTGLLVSAASAAFSVLVGHLGVLREPRSLERVALPRLDLLRAWRAPGVRRHALRHLIAVAAAGVAGVLIGTRYGGSHPYWAMVAAVAALSGPTLRARVTRGSQRFVGTLLGVAFAAVILPLHPRGVVAVCVITALQVAAELLVGRNYALALVFVTPLALMMGQLVHEVAVTPLLVDRAVETLIGCAVALVVLVLERHARPASSA